MDENVEKVSIVALVCGLISIFIFPLLFGTAGIVLGYTVMSRVEDKTSRSYANGRIGLIAGIVGIALWFITLATMGLFGLNPNSLLGGAGSSGPSAF